MKARLWVEGGVITDAMYNDDEGVGGGCAEGGGAEGWEGGLGWGDGQGWGSGDVGDGDGEMPVWGSGCQTGVMMATEHLEMR